MVKTTKTELLRRGARHQTRRKRDPVEDEVSAGEGVRGDVVRGEGAGPRMRDRHCPLTHRHGLRRGLAQRHTVVPGQACPQA